MNFEKYKKKKKQFLIYGFDSQRTLLQVGVNEIKLHAINFY